MFFQLLFCYLDCFLKVAGGSLQLTGCCLIKPEFRIAHAFFQAHRKHLGKPIVLALTENTFCFFSEHKCLHPSCHIQELLVSGFQLFINGIPMNFRIAFCLHAFWLKRATCTIFKFIDIDLLKSERILCGTV